MFIFQALDLFAALLLPMISPCFAQAGNDKMRAANESYTLKMKINVILSKIVHLLIFFSSKMTSCILEPLRFRVYRAGSSHVKVFSIE